MGQGLPMYHVERVVQEISTLFQDGAHIIYVNGNYKNNDTPVGRLLHDFRYTSAMDMFYEELKKRLDILRKQKGVSVKCVKHWKLQIHGKIMSHFMKLYSKLS